MAIKCSCGSENCITKIWFNENQIWFANDLLVGKCPSELSIYLDANALVELIKEARKALVAMTEVKDGD